MIGTKVKEIRDALAGYPDDAVVEFSIDESVCEQLMDSYRYSPDIYFSKENDGSLVGVITSQYSR